MATHRPYDSAAILCSSVWLSERLGLHCVTGLDPQSDFARISRDHMRIVQRRLLARPRPGLLTLPEHSARALIVDGAT
jgi:hypothetical protein